MIHLCASICFLAIAANPIQCFAEGDETFESKLDAYIQPYLDARDFAGTILVASNGKIQVHKAYGFSNLEHGVEHTIHSKFRIGSISKHFTSVAILILQERNKLEVDDTVSKYLPEYPNGDRITLHHLMTHRSGIPNYVNFAGYDDVRKKKYSGEQAIEWFKDKPLDFEPGGGYSYSNSGYVLLRLIIEKVSGEPFREFMKKNVFEPAKLNETTIADADEIIENRATGYIPGPPPAQLLNGPVNEESIDLGASGIVSTCGDLYKWHQALKTDTVLSVTSRQRLFTNHGNSYGYGLSIYKRFGRRVQEHDGLTDGFTSFFGRLPDDDGCVVILSNIWAGMRDRIARDLFAMLFEEEYEIPQTRTYVDVDHKALEKFTGKYSFPPGFTFEIIADHGSLYLSWMGRARTYLSPLSNNEFFMRIRYDKLTFIQDAQGAVNSVVWRLGDNDFTCQRIE